MKTLDIALLKKHGYLKPGQKQSGVVTWSNCYGKTGNIAITVEITFASGCLQLDYTSNGKPINYKIELVTMPSNLGKGLVWYFLCPKTAKHCRKLHMVGGYLYHRLAFTNFLYDKQTESSKQRFTGKLFDKWDNADKAIKKINSKHFKKQYKGNYTKAYLNCLKKIDQGQGITLNALLTM
jgi:hypothetical protein